MKKIIVVVAVFCLLLGGTVYAVGPATATWIREERGSGTASSTQQTEAGNITWANLSSDSITTRWAGFLGNITGNIVLESSGGTDFYRWSAGVGVSGEVCASRTNSFTWALLQNTSGSELDTIWNFTTGSDQAVDTFVVTERNFSCGDIAGNNLNVTAVNLAPDTATDKFESCILSNESTPDTTREFMFCTAIVNDAPDFNGGGTSDYEILVPIGYGQKDTFYFYVELG